MPFTNIDYNLLSDLVVNERDPSAGWARKVISVTIAAGATLPLGAVVFRVKGINPAAQWGVLTDGDDNLITNEYAVVIGDRYDTDNKEVVVPAATATPVLAYVRGDVILKQKPILNYLVNTVGLSEAEAGETLHLLEQQGVLSETTIGYDPTA